MKQYGIRLSIWIPWSVVLSSNSSSVTYNCVTLDELFNLYLL